jgi:hypothetical protein
MYSTFVIVLLQPGPRHSAAAVRRTGVTEYRAAAGGLLRLDVGRPDHFAPLSVSSATSLPGNEASWPLGGTRFGD